MSVSISASDLPGLNFTAVLTADDFEFYDDTFVEELLNRFRLSFMGDFTAVNSYGIVEDIDPAQTTATALFPQAVSGNAFAFNVSPGTAVTPKGQLIPITVVQPVIIPQVNGTTFYIVAQYLLVQANFRIINFNQEVPTRTELDVQANLITVMTASAWAALTPSQAQTTVIIGVVAVGLDPSTGLLTTALDVTRSTVAANRPWFSLVDIQHRNAVGNVHRLTTEELDDGTLPLLEKFQSEGFIVAQDLQFQDFPGALCIQSLLRINVTQSPPYTISLPRRAVRFGRCYLQSTPTTELSYAYDPVQNLITFVAQPFTPTDDDPGDMFIDTLCVNTLEPTLLTTVVRMTAIPAASAGESAISQGLPIRSLPATDVPINDFGPGATQRADVYCAANGTLVRTPQTLICQGRIGSDLPINQSIPISTLMLAPGVVRLIITDVVDVACDVTVTGVDTSGTAATETIHLAFDHTEPNGIIPSSSLTLIDDPSQFGKLQSSDTGCVLPPEFKRQARVVTLASAPCRYGQQVFGSISAIQIANQVGGSPNANLTVQVLLDTRTMLPVAEIVENNGVPQTMVDMRPVVCGLLRPDRGIDAALQEVRAELGGANPLFYIENCSAPKLADFRITNLVDPRNSTTPGNTQLYVTRILPMTTSTHSPKLQVLASADLTGLIEFFHITSSGSSVFATTSIISTASGIALNTSSSINGIRLTMRAQVIRGFVITATT